MPAPGDAGPTLFGIPMKWVSLLMLVAQTVSVVFFMRLSRSASVEGPRYLNTTAVFFSECMKLGCSFLFLWYEKGTLGDALTEVRTKFMKTPFELLKVSVPGLLYVLQNNLLFISLSNLSAAVYQVTYQLKILTTALLSVAILGKSLGGTKWSALVMLTVGVTLLQVPRGAPSGAGADEFADVTTTTSTTAAGAHGGNEAIGLAAVLSACMTSGLAGVTLEKLLKQSDASMWLRNIQLAFFGVLMGFVGALVQDGAKIKEDGFLQGYSSLVWGVITLQAVGGLVVATVLKYADNILKCFGNAMSIILTSLLSAILLNELTIDTLFVIGTILVLVATTIYNLGVPESVQKLWNQQLGGSRKTKIEYDIPQKV